MGAVLHEAEPHDDGNEDGQEIPRSHVLPDVDVEGNQAEKICKGRRKSADDVVLCPCGNMHTMNLS